MSNKEAKARIKINNRIEDNSFNQAGLGKKIY